MSYAINPNGNEMILCTLNAYGEIIHREPLSRKDAVTLAFNLIAHATETAPKHVEKEVRSGKVAGERFTILELGDAIPEERRLKSAFQLVFSDDYGLRAS